MDKFAKSVLALLILGVILIGAALITQSGQAEALPSVTINDLYRAEGALRISEAPAEDLALDWIRVDVVYGEQIDADTLEAEVWVPWPPGEIRDLVLFDGYHLVHGWWMIHEDGHITIKFRADDVRALDGTVGLYLIAILEGAYQ